MYPKNLKILFQEHSVESYSVNLPKSLSESGPEVTLLTWQPKRKKKFTTGVNVSCYSLSKLFWALPKTRKKLEPYTFYPWFLKLVKKKEFNLLHVNAASKSDIFIKAKISYDIPLVYTNHYVPEPEPLECYTDDFSINEKEKLWIPRVCEHASEVVTVSEYAKKKLKKMFGIDSACIYHGVDLKKYNPSIPQNKKIFGCKPNENVVLWVARFGHHPYKDPFTFIRAIPLVLKQFSNTTFVMIGNGFLEPYILALAKKLKIQNHLKIINFVENLNCYYAACDVFVLPTFNDNFGCVVSEAMACGKPVVVSNKGAPQEFVGDAGILFEYGSEQDLAKKIILLLGNESLRKKLGIKANNIIAKNFTWEKAAQEYNDLYAKIL